MGDYYNWFKAFHIISIICWMAGMLYLPRLFVYHTEVEKNTAEDKRFQLMELRLQRFIITPAMIISIITGSCLVYVYGWGNLGMWFHLKLLLVFIMCVLHAYMSLCRKSFLQSKNLHTQKFYRIFNEIPTILMIFIVVLVAVKPFED